MIVAIVVVSLVAGITSARATESTSAATSTTAATSSAAATTSAATSAAAPASSTQALGAVNFDHRLDGYAPKKNNYNFYFTYKIVHAWWDAVALGIEDAQRQFLAQGVTITYEYVAPKAASAEDQTKRLQEAAKGSYDVIGVDVADEDVISPLLDQLVNEGKKVMIFSSSDAAKGCKRIAYVGNTHNYEDGILLTEALCKQLDYQGKIAILVGNEGVPCHEDRARGAKETIAKYPNMEIVDVAYDEDSVQRAQTLTEDILARHDDLAGIICCNMSNPVGAARAVDKVGGFYLQELAGHRSQVISGSLRTHFDQMRRAMDLMATETLARRTSSAPSLQRSSSSTTSSSSPS